jgi:proteasome lid subunit RPN8/RPN11
LTQMNNNKNGWEADLKIINHMNAIVPVRLLLVCNYIASRVRDNEFSIVTTIKEKTPDTVIVSDEFYIPKQVVAHTSIEYQPDTYKQNVCIHRHPDGMKYFSSTDREYINQNFELSLLYTLDQGFVNGIYNHKADNNCLIQIPVDVQVDYNLEEVDLSNIIVESDIMFSDSRKDREHKSEINLEKIDVKKDNESDDKQLRDLEERLLMLEEAVFYGEMQPVRQF